LTEGSEPGSGPGPWPSEEADELPTMPPNPNFGKALRWAVPEPVGSGTPVPHRPPGPPTRPAERAQPATSPQPYEDLAALEAAVLANGTPGAPKNRWLARSALVLAVLAVVAGTTVGVISLTQHSPRQAAAVFAGLLRQSDSAHKLVDEAVGAACAVVAPDQPARAADLASLAQAVALRTSVLAQLSSQQDQAAHLPDGDQLFNRLRAVSVASLAADRAYQSWLDDLQATGCYSAPTNNLDYAAAIRAATVASADVQLLETAWAGTAPKLKLPLSLAAEA
jgi:hypothetical protein